MKIAVIVTRVLMGLLFAMSAIVVLFKLVPQPVMEGKIKIFNDGMEASVYLMPLIKVIELLCGLSFLSNRFVPLATVVIFPVTVNIVLFHLFLGPEGLALPVLLLLGNLFLAYTYKENYKPLMLAK